MSAKYGLKYWVRPVKAWSCLALIAFKVDPSLVHSTIKPSPKFSRVSSVDNLPDDDAHGDPASVDRAHSFPVSWHQLREGELYLPHEELGFTRTYSVFQVKQRKEAIEEKLEPSNNLGYVWSSLTRRLHRIFFISTLMCFFLPRFPCVGSSSKTMLRNQAILHTSSHPRPEPSLASFDVRDSAQGEQLYAYQASARFLIGITHSALAFQKHMLSVIMFLSCSILFIRTVGLKHL